MNNRLLNSWLWLMLLLMAFGTASFGQTPLPNTPPIALMAYNSTGLSSGSWNPFTAAAGAQALPSTPTTIYGMAYKGTDGNYYACTLALCFGGGGGGTGTVTNVATSGPITGGPITNTGTIGCPTCGVTGSPLSQFAVTTSAQLAGILSDETGTGLAVFGTSPTLITPSLGTPSALVLTNATALPNSGLINSSTTVNGQSCTLGSPCTITANNPNSVTFAASGGASSGSTYNGASALTVSATTVGALPSTGVYQSTAVADDFQSTTGAQSASSTTFTDSTAAPFIAGSVGKTIIIPNCGPGNNNGLGLNTFSAITNSGGNAVMTVVAGTGNAGTLATGNAVFVTLGTGTGITTGLYYVSVSGANASLFTDPGLTTPVAFTATATGQFGFGPVALTTTIATFVSASQVTTTATCSTGYAGTTAYHFGTNNTAAFQADLTALNTLVGAQTQKYYHIPAGQYLIGGTAVAAGAAKNFASSGIGVAFNNINIVGDGPTATILYNSIVGGAGMQFVALTGGSVQNLTLNQAVPSIQRYAYQAANYGLSISNVKSNSTGAWYANNVQIGGFINEMGASNATNVTFYDMVLHDWSANGMVASGTVANPLLNVGFQNLIAYNGNDAMLSLSAATGQAAGMNHFFCRSCSMTNEGANAIEVFGGTNYEFTDTYCNSIFLACMRVVPATGFDNVTGVVFSGVINQAGNPSAAVSGASANTAGSQAVPAGILIGPQSSSKTVNDVQIRHVRFTGGTGGPYIAAGCLTQALTSCSVNNLQIGPIEADGGQTAPNGTSQQATSSWTRTAGFEFYNTVGLSILSSNINNSFADPVFLDTTVTGACSVGQITGFGSNTNNTASSFGVNNKAAACTSVVQPSFASSVGTLTAPSTMNCTSAASPAVCGVATSGATVVAATATTVVVNTSAVTANSNISLVGNSALGTRLGVTCNTTPSLLSVSAISTGVSFTVTTTAPAVNPMCLNFTITNP